MRVERRATVSEPCAADLTSRSTLASASPPWRSRFTSKNSTTVKHCSRISDGIGTWTKTKDKRGRYGRTGKASGMARCSPPPPLNDAVVEDNGYQELLHFSAKLIATEGETAINITVDTKATQAQQGATTKPEESQTLLAAAKYKMPLLRHRRRMKATSCSRCDSPPP